MDVKPSPNKLSEFAEEFRKLVDKYEIINIDTQRVSNDYTSQEVTVVDNFQTIAMLQKEICKIETWKQEHMHRNQLEEIYSSLKDQLDIITCVSSALVMLGENQLAICRILSTPVREDALLIPQHLHVKIVELFRNLVLICNNYRDITKTMPQARNPDVKETVDVLLEAVDSVDFAAFKQDVEAVERFFASLEKVG